MTLPHLPLPAKGPVYPHPVLLGSSSLYPAHLAAPKHGLPYGLPPAHGEFLTYHDSQKMVHPLMSPHLALDPNTGERPERRPRPQDKARRGAEPADTPQKAERAAPKPLPPGPKLQAKHPPQPPVAGRDRAAGCIVEPAREDTAHRDADRARLLSGRSEISEGAELEEQGVPLPAAVARQPHVSPSRPVPHSPDRTPDQTLRCARTSGDRSGETEAHGTRRYLEASMEGGIADQESQEEEDDEDDDYEGSNGSSRTWKSSLAKRIANSSGYVGDRFKYVTTELYADSSKLSREQRALQMEGLTQEDSISQPAPNRERAMLRFSELELKEREGGAVADGQQPMEAEWEGCPHISRLRGVALDDEAERDGVRSAPSGPCGGNRVPVLQRCGVLREHRDQGRPGQEEAGPGGAAARKRSHAHLEERQAGEGDWEMAVLQAKRSRLSGGLPAHGEEVDTLALLEKRQRLKEQHRGGVIEVTSLEEAGPDGDSAPRLHRHGDLEKPKGKRQCKTKHISLRDRPQTAPSAEESADPQPDPEQKVCSEQASLAGPASPSDYYSPPAKPLPLAEPSCPHTPCRS
ncbi:hypothetical protein ANANG_G00276550 [Anguilla anguilla]|uniref:BCL-6 corepressor non-ankyrin-repeat domain-containing protein n=1 Tax=Anguilla anguilla TaxID=7936 RepID=A0A9D3LNH8_ANGAN|nr:hypothetical protein ANANG_G00276550 [Anguilla anguilla]